MFHLADKARIPWVMNKHDGIGIRLKYFPIKEGGEAV